MRPLLVVTTFICVLASLAGCGIIDPAETDYVADVVWLPSGAVYYLDDGFEVHRWDESPSRVLLKSAASLIGTECANEWLRGLFIAPDGGLGLEYDCSETKLLELTANGTMRFLGELPQGWGNLTVRSGKSLNGFVSRGSSSADGGRCLAIRPLVEGVLGEPLGGPMDSPLSCAAPHSTSIGAFDPATRRDGRYTAFVVETAGDGGRITDRIWWWQTGSPAPVAVGPTFSGIDALSTDPVDDVVAITQGFGGADGITLMNLRSGATTTACHGTAWNATFSPDGKSVAYTDGRASLRRCDLPR